MVLGFADFAFLAFPGLCRFSFCRFSDYEAFCVWILTFLRSCDFCFWDFGILVFVDFGILGIPPRSPASQKWVPSTSIFAQEAAASTQRRSRCLVRCLCSREALADSCD